ncbi:MAG: isopentenyl phosphate kinase [Candidatus Thermoplasmatota archaeon]
MSLMFIVKLGGSVITDKKKKNHFRRNIMDRLSSEIKKSDHEMIIVHGAGSFGHILAKKYRLNEGYKNRDQLKGFVLTHASVQDLNSKVIKSLQDKGLLSVSIPPHAILQLDKHRLTSFNYAVFSAYLKHGFLPVTFGDVVLDRKLVFSICSGDLLMQALATSLKPEKAIFVIDEDGLYTSNPKDDPNASFIESITINELKHLTVSDNRYADVTEGMRGKINTIQSIARSGVDTILVNGNQPQRLYDILSGRETVCTYIKAKKI